MDHLGDVVASGGCRSGIGLALLDWGLGAAAGTGLFQLLEAEFIVFLLLADRLLHLQKLKAHLFDPAVQLPQLLFELLHADLCIAALHLDDRRRRLVFRGSAAEM